MARSQGGLSYDQSQVYANQIRERLGMNLPLPLQYLHWIKGIVLYGDFGQSFLYNKPVLALLGDRFWRTLGIAAVCHLFATFIGVSLGIVGAVNQHRWGDTVASAIAFLGMTIPRFFMALIILYWLAFVVGSQYLGSIYSPQFIFAPFSFAKAWDLLKHVWPIIFVATFGGLAYNMRVMRGNLLDVLRQPFIEAARAKGLPNHTVILKHAVPNALHPLVMYQGVAMPYMLSGELEVAIILGFPTVGPLMLDSLYRGDVWVTATIFLGLSVILVVANILADILLSVLDPRIRLLGSQ
jgi:peptide/nickel transport system permease protein